MNQPVHSTVANTTVANSLSSRLIPSQVNHLTLPALPNSFIFKLAPEHFIEENIETL